MFDILVFVAFAALVGLLNHLGTRWRGIVRQQRRVETWFEVAKAAGLQELEQHGALSDWELTGRFKRHVVRIGRRRNTQENLAEQCVLLEGRSGITLRPENPDNPLDKAFSARETEIGDELFDAAAYVHGREDVLRAVLDAGTRDMVRELLGGRVRLAGFKTMGVEAGVRVLDGDLIACFSGQGVDWAWRQFPGILGTLVDVADRLEPPEDVPRRIADNNLNEPEWRVRLANLALLENQYPNHPATREALKRACGDENEEVQLRAALAVGAAEGRSTLLDIATREWSSDVCAARAVAALGPNLPKERATAGLAHAMRSRRFETAAAFMETIGRGGGQDVVAPLAKVLAHGSSRLAIAAARALGLTREASAEAPLLAAMRRDEPGLRLAVAEALGRVGSAAAVASLREAEAGPLDVGFRRAARQAIAEIHARLQGAAPGQLSLAPDAAGSLSLADEDPRGRVALADDKAN